MRCWPASKKRGWPFEPDPSFVSYDSFDVTSRTFRIRTFFEEPRWISKSCRTDISKFFRRESHILRECR